MKGVSIVRAEMMVRMMMMMMMMKLLSDGDAGLLWGSHFLYFQLVKARHWDFKNILVNLIIYYLLYFL